MECIALIALHEAAVMNKHTADGIINMKVLDGEITFSTDGQSEVIRKNQMIPLHKGLSPPLCKSDKRISVFVNAYYSFRNLKFVSGY